MPDEKKSPDSKAAHHSTSGPIFGILSPKAGDTVSQVFNVIGTYPTDGKTVTVTITPTGDTESAVVSDKTWIVAFDPAQACSPATITATTATATDPPQSVTNVNISDNPIAIFELVD
jgi:hypothetical protein